MWAIWVAPEDAGYCAKTQYMPFSSLGPETSTFAHAIAANNGADDLGLLPLSMEQSATCTAWRHWSSTGFRESSVAQFSLTTWMLPQEIPRPRVELSGANGSDMLAGRLGLPDVRGVRYTVR